MKIVISESQLRMVSEVMVDVEKGKVETVKKFLEDFNDWHKRRLVKVDDYEYLPKGFREGRIFGFIVWHHYTKLGGQFFYISMGSRKYIVLLLNNKLAGINKVGEHVKISDLEQLMGLEKWGLKLIDVLTNYPL